MSGQLIGQVVGSFFGPWGSLIGGMIGAWLDPPEGPDLGDLKPQSSEYGRPIPIAYGTIAIGGNVIWASDFTIVEGGKGGEPEQAAVYGNMAVLICEGERTLGRIWAGPDKRLIWDGVTLEGADAGALLRFYPGSETQLPDPLIESYEGVGNVPGYRGSAYIVLEHFPLLKDGNRLPFLTIETGAIVNQAPENLGVFFVQQTFIIDEWYVVVYWGSLRGFIIRRLDNNRLYHHFSPYPILEWRNIGPLMFFDSDRLLFVQPRGDLFYNTYSFVNGADEVGVAITAAAGAETNPGNLTVGGVYYGGYYIFGAKNSPGEPERVSLYVIDPETNDPVATYTALTPTAVTGPIIAPLDGVSPYIYVVGSGGTLTRVGLSLAATPVDMGDISPTALEMNIRMDPNTGFIWTVAQVGATLDVHVVDPISLTTIYSEVLAFPANISTFGSCLTFVPGSPNTVIVTGEQWLAIDYFAVFYAGTGAGDPPVQNYQAVGGYHGTMSINAMDYNPVNNTLMAWHDGGNASFGVPTDPTTVNMLLPGTFTQEPDNKYLGERDGVVIPQGELLSVIVADLSERAGLTPEQYDVTALTDMVDGYAIERSTSCRDAVTALMPAYFFDAVESDGKAKFVKRGGAIAVVIPDEDLGAYESGGDPPDSLESTRQMENELPQTLFTRYLLEATKYSTATRYARRLIGSSGDEQTLELPLVLSDTKAQEIAEVNLHGAWVGRITYKVSIPRKYAYLEPTDVIVAGNQTMRLEKVKYVGGRFQCDARHDDSNIYVPSVVVTETPGGDDTVDSGTETILELM
jgi:hypothetical protein